MNEKAFGFLGLLNRGGSLLIGPALANGISKCRLIILAEDAGASTSKLIQNKAKSHDIPVYILASKEELGQAIGYDEVSAIGLTDKKAASHLEDIWKGV